MEPPSNPKGDPSKKADMKVSFPHPTPSPPKPSKHISLCSWIRPPPTAKNADWYYWPFHSNRRERKDMAKKIFCERKEAKENGHPKQPAVSIEEEPQEERVKVSYFARQSEEFETYLEREEARQSQNMEDLLEKMFSGYPLNQMMAHGMKSSGNLAGTEESQTSNATWTPRTKLGMDPDTARKFELLKSELQRTTAVAKSQASTIKLFAKGRVDQEERMSILKGENRRLHAIIAELPNAAISTANQHVPSPSSPVVNMEAGPSTSHQAVPITGSWWDVHNAQLPSASPHPSFNLFERSLSSTRSGSPRDSQDLVTDHENAVVPNVMDSDAVEHHQTHH